MMDEKGLVEEIKVIDKEIANLCHERGINKETMALFQRASSMQKVNMGLAWKRDKEEELNGRQEKINRLIAELNEDNLDINKHLSEYHSVRLNLISIYEEETGIPWS